MRFLRERKETEMSNIEKAYNRGHRMGAYIVSRDGVDRAVERGSLANLVYRTPSMVKAYAEGYDAAVNENR